jgi:hypothetical protein
MQKFMVTHILAFCERVEAMGTSLPLDLACFRTVLCTAFSELFGVIYLHFLVGLAVLVLAIMNYRGLTRTYAPDRLKRISKVTPGMAAFDGLLGIPLYVFTNGTVHGRSTFCI